MSLALYRKYRPGSLAQVKGQEHVTGPLRQALTNGRVHHAYLFSGPRGCGKTSSARILARSLNCAQGPTPDPCGACESCVALAPNGSGSLDVIEIDAASHNGVEDARDLREKAFFAPVRDRFKVYIIDEAHMVTSQAFNALLKLVEEPPEFVKFVFATTEPEKVLQTIRSRTHHYAFRLMPRKDLTGLLAEVVAAEAIAVDPQVLPLVVRAAAGSARDALSILDQVLASAGPAGVTREAAAGLLGVTPEVLLDDVIDAFCVGDAAAVFATVDQVMEGGHEPRRFATDVLERLRDLVILDAVPDAGAKGVLDCPAEQLERMARQAAAFGTAGLSRAADLFHAGLTEMRGTTAPRLLLELVCARVLLPGASADSSAVLTRVERLERRFEIDAPGAAPVRHAPGTVQPAPPPGPADPPTAGHPLTEPVGRPSAAGRATADRPASDGPRAETAPSVGPRAETAPSAGPRAETAPSVGPRAEATTADRQTADPQTADPRIADPRTADSDTVDPETLHAETDGALPTGAAHNVRATSTWPAAAVPGCLAAVPHTGPGSPAPPADDPGATRAAPREGGDAVAGGAGAAGSPSAGSGAAEGPPAAPVGLDAAAVRRLWDTVLEKVKQSKRVTHARLAETQVADVRGRRLSVSFTTPTLARQFGVGVHIEVLRDALREVLGVDLEIVCVSGSNHTAVDGPPARPRPAAADPAVSTPAASAPAASAPAASAPAKTASAASAPAASAPAASAPAASATANAAPAASRPGASEPPPWNPAPAQPRPRATNGDSPQGAPSPSPDPVAPSSRSWPPMPAGFAPGDEPADEEEDPAGPVAGSAAERGEAAALRLVQESLGGRVVGTIDD